MYSRATEEAIIMFMHDYYLIQLDELDNPDLKLEFSNAPGNIYFVCTRPRLSINKELHEINDNGIKLTFNAHIKDKVLPFKIDVEIDYNFHEMTIESDYPYNFFELYNPNGDLFGAGKTCHVVDRFRDKKLPMDFLDLEVLYIGQSLDSTEETPLKKRLLNHSTLQKIYSEIIKNNPDKEVFILVASFDQDNIIHSPSNVRLSEEDEKIDIERALALIKNPSRFTFEQRTNFTEAGLINYFKPPYNADYKVNFPDPRHKSYTECYDLDISQLTVEVDTEDSGYRLYSEAANRKLNHAARYHMPTSEDRRKMFEELLAND